MKTIPYSEEELQEQEDALPILDPLLLADPAYAVRQAAATVDREAQAAEDAYTSYSRLVSGMMSGAEEEAEVLASIRSECGRIAKFEKQIQEYLIKSLTRRSRPKPPERLHACSLSARISAGSAAG